MKRKIEMKKFPQTWAAVLIVIAAGTANAQSLNNSTMAKDSGWYGEVGYLGLKNTDDTGSAVKPKLLRLTVGKDINQNLSVEAMAGLTASKASVAVSQSTTGKVSNTFYGLYLKPRYEITSDVTLFGRAGAAHTTLKEDYSDGTPSASLASTKFSYGLGVEVKFTDAIYGSFDYMQYGKYSDNTGSVKYNGFAASIGYRF